MQQTTAPGVRERGQEQTPGTEKELERQLGLLREAEERGKKDGTLGTARDPRIGFLAGLQEDTAYAIAFSKEGQSGRFDLLHKRISDRRITVTDPRYREEMLKFREMAGMPRITAEEAKPKEEALELSRKQTKEATELFVKAAELTRAGQSEQAAAVLGNASKALTAAVEALYPDARKHKER